MVGPRCSMQTLNHGVHTQNIHGIKNSMTFSGCFHGQALCRGFTFNLSCTHIFTVHSLPWLTSKAESPEPRTNLSHPGEDLAVLGINWFKLPHAYYLLSLSPSFTCLAKTESKAGPRRTYRLSSLVSFASGHAMTYVCIQP